MPSVSLLVVQLPDQLIVPGKVMAVVIDAYSL